MTDEGQWNIPGLSKRRFLKGLASTSGLVALGRSGKSDAAGSYATSYEVNPGETYDVIVVGAGTAGIPLAIFAAQRGGKVLVIEKSGQIGGTLFFSGGMMSAAGTKLQQRKGIQDSAQEFYEDTMRLAHNKADPPVLRTYVSNAADTLNWLDDLGVKWQPGHPITGTSHADFKKPRYQAGVEAGRSLLKVMLPEFLKAEAKGNLRVLMRTSCEELVQDGNKAVTGVIVLGEDGKRTQYKARNVVLTSGGCLMNPVLFERYNFKPLYGRRVYSYSMGKGLELGVAAGGRVSGGEHFIAHRGVIMSDRNFPSPQFTNIFSSLDPRMRMPWEIEVNKLGQRYVAEDADLDILERAQTNQPGMACFLIWDQEIYDKAPAMFKNLTPERQQSAFDTHPMFGRANSIEELARKMALPPDRLSATVASYNNAVAAQSDPEFGRKHMPLPIVRAPFYAVECLGSAIFGHAGLDIDGDLRVITADRKPINNLYAAGEVTGGWHNSGDVVVNGCMVTPAITFGRLLGSKLLNFKA